ncbi:hypothetical protein JW848_11270 [Candidatus Bipolaricaulota bacterium]|nr:hypothetical protein [Candidatus Bipolaricaulota bacterium]
MKTSRCVKRACAIMKHWLIQKLAGSSPIMLNCEIRDGILSIKADQRSGLIRGNSFVSSIR